MTCVAGGIVFLGIQNKILVMKPLKGSSEAARRMVRRTLRYFLQLPCLQLAAPPPKLYPACLKNCQLAAPPPKLYPACLKYCQLHRLDLDRGLAWIHKARAEVASSKYLTFNQEILITSPMLLGSTQGQKDFLHSRFDGLTDGILW